MVSCAGVNIPIKVVVQARECGAYFPGLQIDQCNNVSLSARIIQEVIFPLIACPQDFETDARLCLLELAFVNKRMEAYYFGTVGTALSILEY